MVEREFLGDESDSSAADQLVVSKSERRQQRPNLEHTAKVPTKKESTPTQPVPVHSNKHDLIVAVVGDGTFLFGVPSTAYWMARRYNTVNGLFIASYACRKTELYP